MTSKQSDSGEDVLLQVEYDIEEDVAAELEEFVHLSHTGQFEDAHELFDECLSSYDSWFPVVAEYADCLLREGEFEQLAAFVQRVSENFHDPRENALLELMKMIGHLLPVRVIWQRLQDLWPDLPLTPPYASLRDVDIHLLEIILQILVLIRSSPDNLDGIAENFLPTRSWTTFKDWFHYLLHHELFWEAQRILHSLLHELPRSECQGLIQNYIAKFLVTKVGHKSVRIAVSSMVQRFIYVFKSTHSTPLAAVRWNDAVSWALFGETFGKADEISSSLFSRICFRRSLQKELELSIILPLNGVNEDDKLDDLIHEAAMNGDTAMMQAIIAGPAHYTLDELNAWALSSTAPLYSCGTMPFINPANVDARDCLQRTPLHWASLFGQRHAVETLLRSGEADAGLLDWFGCTPLHYAVRSSVPASETGHLWIIEALLTSESASVNTRDASGLTPLLMAILNQTYDVAEVLLQHNTRIETSDYGALLQIGMGDLDRLCRWKNLLSKHDSIHHILGDFSIDRIEAFAAFGLAQGSSIYYDAPLSYPGIIELDTAAARILRSIPPKAEARVFEALLNFLKSDYSNSVSPALQWKHTYTYLIHTPGLRRPSKSLSFLHEGIRYIRSDPTIRRTDVD